MISSSKKFFIIFFGAVSISIVCIYNSIYIKHSYKQYLSEGDVPTFSEMYLDLYHTIFNNFNK